MNGTAPDNAFDEEDEDGCWGQCMSCQRDLTENEYALNDVCEDCRPEYLEEWQAKQDRLAEEAAEARWIM